MSRPDLTWTFAARMAQRDHDADLRGNECDPHVALARSESREGPGLRCGTCGKRAEGNYSDDAGPVCDACIEASK